MRSRRRKSAIKVPNPLLVTAGLSSETNTGMDNPSFTARDEVIIYAFKFTSWPITYSTSNVSQPQQRKISSGVRPTLLTIPSGLALEAMDSTEYYSSGKVLIWFN